MRGCRPLHGRSYLVSNDATDGSSFATLKEHGDVVRRFFGRLSFQAEGVAPLRFFMVKRHAIFANVS